MSEPPDSGAAPPPDGGDGCRRAYLLSGHVQGVGFRWWTARTARGLRLRGTVRNRPDGRVELHVEGSQAAVTTLEERLWRGPPAARVEDVERIEPHPDLPTEFRITG